MIKTIIVYIPMKVNIAQKMRYLPGSGVNHVSNVPVSYPILAYLADDISKEDTLNCLLLKKNSLYGKEDECLTLFQEELEMINQDKGAKTIYTILETDFGQEPKTYERLMESIIDHLEDGANIYVDITYGSKDLPLVLFSVLSFAEKHLYCNIERIIYGQGSLDQDDKFAGGTVCDMMPLYSLQSMTESIPVGHPKDARKMLKDIIAL